MEFRTQWILTCLVLETLHIQTSYSKGPQLYFSSFKGDTVEVLEKHHLNLTFWIDVSSCKDPAALYRLEVQTSRTDRTYDDDGRVVRWKNKCEVTFNNSVHCISDDGPAELYKEVNRSHKEVIWTLSWKDPDSKKPSTKQTRLKLNIKRPVTPSNHSIFPLDIDKGIHYFKVNTTTAHSKDEPVRCNLESDGRCVQNILLSGVEKSTFDIYYLYPNDTKSVVVGCELLGNSNFTCFCECTYSDSKSGIFNVSVSSASTCIEKEFLKFTHEHTTVECNSKQGRVGTVKPNVTLSPEGVGDDVSTVEVAVPIGIVVAVIGIVFISIVLYKKGCKQDKNLDRSWIPLHIRR